jgi:hypothetical protein
MATDDLICEADHDYSHYRMIPEYDGASFAKRAVPFSSSRPLLFHVVTHLPPAGAGDRALLDMISKGLDLVPPKQSGPGRDGLMYPRDVAAGDDRYLFLSALNTFRLKIPGAQEPALAFDAASLWDASEDGFAFRVHDLELIYKSIEQRVDDFSLLPSDDEEPDWEDQTQEYREAYLEAQRPEFVRDELECAAKLGTQFDPDKAWELLRIYAGLVDGTIPAADAWALASEFTPEEPHYEECEEAWVLEDDWGYLFGEAAAAGIARVWQNQIGVGPEILYPARLPLCCAVFWRDHRGVWAPVPADLCAAGRAARGLA